MEGAVELFLDPKGVVLFFCLERGWEQTFRGVRQEGVVLIFQLISQDARYSKNQTSLVWVSEWLFFPIYKSMSLVSLSTQQTVLEALARIIF